METFDDWWRENTPELGIDLILVLFKSSSKSKKVELTRNCIVTCMEQIWKHQDRKIEKLSMQILRLKAENLSLSNL